MIEILGSELVYNTTRTYLEIEHDEVTLERRYYIYIPFNLEERELLDVTKGMAIRLEVKIK